MAIGDRTAYADGRTVAFELLASSTATNSPPSGGSAGMAMSVVTDALGLPMPLDFTLLVYSTAGSGTMTVTCRLWGYTLINSGMWMPLGVGADATKGTINAASALGETGTDIIRHAETVSLAGHFQRLYLEITAIGGTSTAVTAQLVTRRDW